jgi:hypothetical protein
MHADVAQDALIEFRERARLPFLAPRAQPALPPGIARPADADFPALAVGARELRL